MSTIGERLKQLRKEKKIMQKDLAVFLEIPLRTLQSYEYNEVEPSITTITKLADYFDTSLDFITGRSDDPTRH